MSTGPIVFATKWQPLSIYFENITYEDLADLTRDGLLEVAKREHRLLMDLFIKHELEDYLNQENPYRSKFGFMSVFPSKPTTIEECLENKTYLDLRNRVCTAKFPQCARNLFCMKDLVTMEIPHLEGIEVLDLSRNNLWDFDMPYIIKLIQRLPKCHTVVLIQNRFFGSTYGNTPLHSFYPQEGEIRDDGHSEEGEDSDSEDETENMSENPIESQTTPNSFDDALATLLDLPQVRYVDLTKTQVASHHRWDLYPKLTSEQLGKLIWVEERWLHHANSGWRNLLATREALTDPVMQLHETYYRDVKPSFPAMKSLGYLHD